MKRLSCWVLLWFGACLAPPALAHSTSTSFMALEIPRDGPTVGVRWDISLHDIVWTILVDSDYDGVVTWEEVQAARPTIERVVVGELAVARGDKPCALAVRDLALAQRLEQNFLSVAMRAECTQPGRVSIGGGLFLTGDASQRVLLSATHDGVTFQGVLGPGAPRWTEPEHASVWQSFVRFVGEGVWHVLIGYDHIAFLLLLLLPAVLRPVDGKWQGATRLPQVAREIFTIITAFTIAHSITLALAVTGTVHLPTRPIEVAIAASIAVAGLINLLPRLSNLRLPLAFGFGFVHGFGFANALSEIDAAGSALLPLLAGFNIGVEIAQLAIVAVVLPLIYAARATRWYAAGVVPLGSCALGAAGLVWVYQRL